MPPARLPPRVFALFTVLACSMPTGPTEPKIHELHIDAPGTVTQPVGTSVVLRAYAIRYVNCTLEYCSTDYLDVDVDWRSTDPEVAALWNYATGKRARLLAEGTAKIIAQARGLADTLQIIVTPRE